MAAECEEIVVHADAAHREDSFQGGEHLLERGARRDERVLRGPIGRPPAPAASFDPHPRHSAGAACDSSLTKTCGTM